MRRFSLIALALLLTPLFATLSPAQEPIQLDFRGIELFAALLDHAGFQTLDSFEDLEQAEPNETLVVLMGDLEALDHWGRRLKHFHDRGCALLVASDRADQQRLQPWKITIHGNLIVQKPETAYRNKPACPHLIISKLWTDALARGFSLDKGLAANGPSNLETTDKNLEVLAYFPKDCTVSDSNIPPGRLLYGLVTPSTIDAKGPLIVLAGHGTFFNGMMIQKDSENFKFAWNCIQWLKEGKRRQVLFVVNDGIVPSLALPGLIPPELPAPPLPSPELIENLLLSMQGRIRDLEEEDVFNRYLVEAFGRESLLRFVLLVASLALLMYGSWRLVRARLWLEKNVPLVIEGEAPGVALSALQQRQQSQTQMDNYSELAQTLIRQWFWQHAQVDPVQWHQDGFQLPSFTVQGSWWQHWRHYRQLHQLKELAQFPEPINSRRLKIIQSLLDDLNTALSTRQLFFS
jgi:hypothetical protein